MSTPFMTSPIGDLTIDSEGLRTAIDEIARLRKIIEDRIAEDKTNRTWLRFCYKGMHTICEVAVKSVHVIKTPSKEFLYYEKFSDKTGYGTRIDMEKIGAWEVKGTSPCSGEALLKL